MLIIFLIFFCHIAYLICTPNRVRFNKYTEWSLFNPDDSDRGVVIIDPDWKDSPDYHAPDAIRRYPRETSAPLPGWVKRVAWVSLFLVVIVASWSIT